MLRFVLNFKLNGPFREEKGKKVQENRYTGYFKESPFEGKHLNFEDCDKLGKNIL